MLQNPQRGPSSTQRTTKTGPASTTGPVGMGIVDRLCRMTITGTTVTRSVCAGGVLSNGRSLSLLAREHPAQIITDEVLVLLAVMSRGHKQRSAVQPRARFGEFDHLF